MDILQVYRLVNRIQVLERMLQKEYRNGSPMRCPMHFCLGQEVTPAVLSQYLRTDDVLFSSYRNHGWYLAKGGDMQAMVSEFYGKVDGCSRGYVGSQELTDHTINFYSGAILSGQTAVALGTAFAQKLRGQKQITVCVLGDGAMEEGVVYEALNCAAKWSLPILFICENNRLAVTTGISVRSNTSPRQRAEGFGIRTYFDQGVNPLELDLAFKTILSDVRNNEPVFLEAMTERQCGHVGPESPAAPYNELYLLKLWEQAVAASSVAVVRDIEDRNSLDVDAAIRFAQQSAATIAMPLSMLSGTTGDCWKDITRSIPIGYAYPAIRAPSGKGPY